jgi:hypothetical protein
MSNNRDDSYQEDLVYYLPAEDKEEIRLRQWKEFCEKLAEQAHLFEGYNEDE